MSGKRRHHEPSELPPSGAATIEWCAGGVTFSLTAALEHDGTVTLTFTHPSGWRLPALNSTACRDFLLSKDKASVTVTDLLLNQIDPPTLH